MSESTASMTTSAAGAAPARGAFIVFEGIDRCGKTTQSKRLVDALVGSGHKAVHMRFPDDTTAIGSVLRSYLKNTTEADDHVIHLMFAANRWECHANIVKLLKSGTTIVCDRYAFSGVAFTSAKKGMDVEWCKCPDRGLPAPDAVFYMQLSIAEAMKRGGFGEERYEKKEFQETVKKLYETALSDASWDFIDANQTPDALHELLKAKTLRLVAAQSERPQSIAKLWTTGNFDG